jgi:hypothetical protein
LIGAALVIETVEIRKKNRHGGRGYVFLKLTFDPFSRGAGLRAGSFRPSSPIEFSTASISEREEKLDYSQDELPERRLDP